MKKLCLLLVFILSTIFFVLPAQASDVHIVVNGVEMSEGQVIMENGRIYLPLRNLGEALGAEVKYLENGAKTELIILSKGSDGVVFRMDKKDYTVIRDGHSAALMVMDVTPIFKEGRVFLPAAYVTEVFGYSLIFKEDEKTIYITQAYTPNTTDNVNQEDVGIDLTKDWKVIKGILNSIFTLYSLMPLGVRF